MKTATRLLSGAAILMAVACSGGFKVRNYPNPVALFRAAEAEFEKRKWGNAITALDQVTILLPPRDTLLPRAHFLLARAYFNDKSFLLASSTYKRLFEEFPDDTLADDALLGMANAEARAWRGPERDDQHAKLAYEAYSLLPRLFPASPFVKEAEEGEIRMREGLGQHDVNRGNYYLRRNMWDSALIYYRDVVEKYPNTGAARDAMIRMVGIYKRLRYLDDAGDVCKQLRTEYAADAAVGQACAGIPADTTR